MLLTNIQEQPGSSFAQNKHGPRFPSHAPSDELIKDNFYDLMERAKSNGWGAQLAMWFQQNRFRMILVITIALLIAGSVIAFKLSAPLSSNLSKNWVAILSEKIASPVIAPTVEMPLQINVDGTSLQTAQPRQEDVLTEQAARGEGTTHLARHALTQRIGTKNLTLSPEQRIYAEDFVRKALGSARVHPGDKLSFTVQLLDDAITKAQNLSPAQIHNLSKYTSRVVF